MSKRQLIEDIRRLNTTAHPKFLAQFEETALKQYLDNLESVREKHVRYAGISAAYPSSKFRMVS